MIEHKIIITGTMGAGKTTAIAAVSEIPPISTDVNNTDANIEKEKTTVAFDYGQVSLGDNETLRLYGTPGQKRFSFMWKLLAKGALGVIILVDSLRPDPLEDLKIYLDNFSSLIESTACVIGITKMVNKDETTINRYASFSAQHGVICPIVAVDIQSKDDILMLLNLLLTQLYI